MPNGAQLGHEWHLEATEAVGEYLKRKYFARQLTLGEIRKYESHKASKGWRIDPGSLDRLIRNTIDIFVDGNFPYSYPRVALPKGPTQLEWPHIEKNGVVCLFTPDSVPKRNDPLGNVEKALHKINEFLGGYENREESEDFREEFLSYWSYHTSKYAPTYLSLIDKVEESQKIAIWKGESFRVAGFSEAEISNWLDNYGIKKPKKGFSFYPGYLIKLPRPLLPKEYPYSLTDAYNLFGRNAPELSRDFVENLVSQFKDLDLILTANTDNGVTFAAVEAISPSKEIICKGFRTNNLPKDIAIERTLRRGKIKTNLVKRVSHNWIHGREHDENQEQLKARRVLIVGCGSLGSGVARELARSGVGSLTLMDSDSLEWANISRHELGGRYAGANKAHALSEVLKKDFPHLKEIKHFSVNFGLDFIKTDWIKQFDLIVSATGDWVTDQLINDVQLELSGIPPVIYCWLEPYGVAGHALYIPSNFMTSCFQCGFTENGEEFETVSVWPTGGAVLQEPACGSVFSPYGAIDVSWVQNLVCELILKNLLENDIEASHWVWIGKKEYLEKSGGQWNMDWIYSHGDPGQGGFILEKYWAKDLNCPACGE